MNYQLTEYNDYYFFVQEAYDELLNSAVFTASSLVTHKKDWICIDMNKPETHKAMAKKAKRYDISNLVVKDGVRIEGYVNTDRLLNSYVLLKEDIQPVNSSTIKGDTVFPELVDFMHNSASGIEDRGSSPLFFVSTDESTERIFGIMTYWDLNRGPAYLYSYLSQLYIEQSVFLEIRRTHGSKEWVSHENMVESLDLENKKEPLRRFVKKGDLRALSKCSLRDLIRFFQLDTHVEHADFELPDHLLSLFDSTGDNNPRNSIAHPVKLLLRDDNDHFREDLDIITELWEFGKRAIVYFKNPKVRLSSMPINNAKY